LKTIISIEQGFIETFGDIAGPFFKDILGMDSEKVLLTDLSSLSDFSLSGEYKSNLLASASLNSLYLEWDHWVLNRIEQHYGLTGLKPNTSLLMLFQEIREKRKLVLLH
jgi:hypothetical protein